MEKYYEKKKQANNDIPKEKKRNENSSILNPIKLKNKVKCSNSLSIEKNNKIINEKNNNSLNKNEGNIFNKIKITPSKTIREYINEKKINPEFSKSLGRNLDYSTL